MLLQESNLLKKLEREEEILANNIQMKSKKDQKQLEKYEMTEKNLKLLQEKRKEIE